ncbi:MAG: hemolysin family protein [Tannerella sp.]|jgi:gliding motility-associated protein GldE|nr:hemolysin family protein [Tannerella sp.]
MIEEIDLFAIALCGAFALLLFASLLSAAGSALSSLPQDDIEKIEAGESARERSAVYLIEHIRLLKASCSVMYSGIIISFTALLMYAAQLLPETVPLRLLIAFVVALLLWALFYNIVPKMFLKNKLGILLFTTPALRSVIRICSPFVRMSNTTVESAAPETNRKNQVPLADEAPGDLYEEQDMLDEIIHFYNKKCNEIMTPRTDIIALDIASDLDAVVNIVVETGYSRLPVFEDNEDKIKGVLFVKDIIPALKSGKTFDWRTLIRKPYYVPESKKIYDLLNELRATKTHIAIVVDEFGCMSGIVTMEDIIEEIIGDISDEYDDDETSFLTLPDGSYIFEGKMQLNDFFRETGISDSEFGEMTDEAETLTGLVLAIKGSLPRRGETVQYRNYRFRILEADARRILKVKFTALEKK